MPKSRVTSCSVSAAVGSSMIRMRALCESALAISTRWRLPTESWPTGCAHIEVADVERVEHLARAVAHRAPVDRAKTVFRRVPHENVFGDGQLGEEQELLVDRRDARLLGVLGRGEAGRLPVERDRAGVGLIDARHDLDQRRFAGAVLAEQRMHLARPHVEADLRQARARPGRIWRCPRA